MSSEVLRSKAQYALLGALGTQSVTRSFVACSIHYLFLLTEYKFFANSLMNLKNIKVRFVLWGLDLWG